MNLENYYYYFKSAVPERICDEIIKHGSQMDSEKAEVDNNNYFPRGGKNIGLDLKRRNSEITWTSDRWVYNEIQPYIYEANKHANWNFSWSYSEPCQITKYKKGGYYDWHCDSWAKPYAVTSDINNSFHNKIRKLSVTVSLSDPKDYEGGELEFDYRNEHPDKKSNIHKCIEILPKGSLVVFPSFVWHRVCPVTSGERNSLVMWNLGDPWQ